MSSVGIRIPVVDYRGLFGPRANDTCDCGPAHCTPDTVLALMGHNPGVFTPLLRAHPGDRVIYSDGALQSIYEIQECGASVARRGIQSEPGIRCRAGFQQERASTAAESPALAFSFSLATAIWFGCPADAPAPVEGTLPCTAWPTCVTRGSAARLPRSPAMFRRAGGGDEVTTRGPATTLTTQIVDVADIVEELEGSRSGGLRELRVEGSDSSDRQNLHARRANFRDRVAGNPGHDGRREPSLLSADHITVRFGGLVAVNDASVRVGAGEIVGLIGPNGAGKTTLFNSLLGLNTAATGRVSLFGRDVTGWDVHRRAALGVGRTFQILQLFGDLTVFDNLLVATHLQNNSGLWGAVVVSERAKHRDAVARERVAAVIRLMDLEAVADQEVSGLPFGILRLVEVARTLVTGAPLVCFDEPASGLDSAETEKLLEWFQLCVGSV
ncbi:MAG: branched-chain amino acid transport system ATP-binding protein [Chloroflexota bacterium]|nr:branched-chain amino acid transport system ATP-binding protein [Chloroflexota bacterium]